MLSKLFLKEAKAINNDTQNGAAMIAEMCLSTLKRECLQLNNKLNRSLLKTAIQLLLDTHPFSSIENALLPIFMKLDRIIESGGIQKGDHKASVELIFATRREQMRIGEKNTIETLTKVLQDRQSILTFSHSSTVSTALLQLAKEGYCDKEIYILESRPLKEGERIALSLANAGFKKVHLGVDFAVNEFSRDAEMVVLGADMINPNGQVLNKLGSATIAKIFQMRSKEVIIAASPSKICLRGIIDKNHEWQPVIPHRNPKEVTTISGTNISVWNKYFEIVQPEWITSLVIDRHKFSSPITVHLKEFLKNSSISDQIDGFKEIWDDADFLMI